MAELQAHKGTEAIRALESQFAELAQEHEPGDLVLPLRDLVVQQLRAGYPREVVLGALDDFRYVFRGTDREDLEDDVVDVMNFLTGWCSPHMKITDEEVSQAKAHTDTSRTAQRGSSGQTPVELTDSARQSFQTLADRTIALQENNLRLTQSFFQNWIEQIRIQSHALQEQGQLQREAFETLSQEATNAYSEFLNSALSFYQEALSAATQVAPGNMKKASQEPQPGLREAQAAGMEAMEAASQAGQQGAEAANQSAQQAARGGEQAGQQAAGEARRGL